MKSPNPEAGFYEADTSRTRDGNGGSPVCNQGGMAIVQTFDGRFTSDGSKVVRVHCYKTATARMLDCGAVNPDRNQGVICVLEGNEQYPLIKVTDITDDHEGIVSRELWDKVPKTSESRSQEINAGIHRKKGCHL